MAKFFSKILKYNREYPKSDSVFYATVRYYTVRTYVRMLEYSVKYMYASIYILLFGGSEHQQIGLMQFSNGHVFDPHWALLDIDALIAQW